MNASHVPPTLLLAEDECRRTGSFFVGTEHLFLAIARQGGEDVERVLRKHNLSLKRAIDRVTPLVCRWEAGDSWNGLLRPTPRLKRITQRAVVLAERDGGKVPQAKHYLVALFEDRHGHTMRALVPQVRGPKPQETTPETSTAANKPADDIQMTFLAPGEESPNPSGGRRLALERHGRDITALARAGQLPPFVGREAELLTLARTLTRQTKPNPLIVGEPGTGKTALVEGLAQRIAKGEVPPALREARIIELSLSSLVAGTQYRGEFEKRLEHILEELLAHPEIILFLDEFHQAIGAGAAGSGTMDAANVLKPALARGEFKCIGATSLREYRKHIEPDTAMVRRFQPLMLSQPTDAETIAILHGLRGKLEAHHNVTILEDAVQAAVRFAARIESDRHQPDKSIDLLDDACTRVVLSSLSHVRPATEGEQESQRPRVGAQHVAEAVSERTGIPFANLSAQESQALAGLEQRLSQVIRGQDEAIGALASALREMRLGLGDEQRPRGVFLFAGPTGVGKTALAELLAREFYGRPESFLRFDMSEYMEGHSVSRLIGAPPGYVGHNEQGQLTKALRARPHALVLLDEIEKAHPQVYDVFLQVFGSGRLTDGRGEVIDCRHAMFVMTSNLGANYDEGSARFGFRTDDGSPQARNEERALRVREALSSQFRPEFLNRIDRIVCFNQLGRGTLASILDQLVEELVQRLATRGVELEVSSDVRASIVAAANLDQGVPPLKRLLRERILSRVAAMLVEHDAADSLHVQASLRDGNIHLEVVHERN